MIDMGHNVAADRLRSFFERWQRLEQAKAEISEDLKELFAEAKSDGWNTKAMRAVFRDKNREESETASDRANRDEFEAVCDLYRSALDGSHARDARMRAREADRGSVQPKDMADGCEPAARSSDESSAKYPEAKASEDNGAENTPKEGGCGVTGDVSRPSLGGGTPAPDSAMADFEPPAFIRAEREPIPLDHRGIPDPGPIPEFLRRYE